MFRLFAIVDPQIRIELSQPVAEDMSRFLSAMEQSPVNLRDLGISGTTVQEILASLRAMFQLNEARSYGSP